MRFPTSARLIATACAFIAAAFAQATDTYRVVHAYPHDQQAFTQGLIYLDGHLYESTGIQGQSSLRDGRPRNRTNPQVPGVPSRYFAEGLTNWGSTLIQLTWQSHVALVYDRSTSAFCAPFRTTAKAGASPRTAKNLILSDGSATLRFFDPATFQRSAAASPSRITASPSPSSMNSNSSTARSTPTSGTPIASPASLPRPAKSSAGSTSPACCPQANAQTPKPCSTASPTMQPTTASSSPANSGPRSSKSKSFPNRSRPFPAKRNK